MTNSTDKTPSPEINAENSLRRAQECLKYLRKQHWPQFFFLYPILTKYQETRAKATSKSNQTPDEFTNYWYHIRANALDILLKNLEETQNYTEYCDYLQKISDIVNDPRVFWNIIHTEIQPSIKVSMKQANEIAHKFFTPEMLFEFGLDSFLSSCLNSISKNAIEDEIIDLFYAVAGYIRACQIEENYIVKSNSFNEFVSKILLMYSSLPNYDAHRFTWLVQVIYDNLHLADKNLKAILTNVLEEIAHQIEFSSKLEDLQRVCVLSTYPFLSEIPILIQLIHKIYNNVIEEQYKFASRYIFGCFVNCLWHLRQSTGKLNDPVIEWKLYLESLCHKRKKMPELPTSLITNFLDNSVSYFVDYYSDVQPTIEKAKDMRLDLLTIVDLVVKYHERNYHENVLTKIWFLLIIVVISGASIEQLKDLTGVDCKDNTQPFLGLTHSVSEFDDYEIAWKRLSKKFSAESERLRSMIDFIRENYCET